MREREKRIKENNDHFFSPLINRLCYSDMLARRIDFNLINKFTCLDNAETQSLFSVVKMRASHVFARLCSIKLHRNENRLRCSQLA